jgi:hypothetical protein
MRAVKGKQTREARLHRFKGAAVTALGPLANLSYCVGMNFLTIRPAGQDDLDLLWDFLRSPLTSRMPMLRVLFLSLPRT